MVLGWIGAGFEYLWTTGDAIRNFCDLFHCHSGWPSRGFGSNQKHASAMTSPAPASPEESSLPLTPNLSLGTLVQDASEHDLWAFDEEVEPLDELGALRLVAPSPRGAEPGIPAQRETYKDRALLRPEDQSAPRISIHEAQIQLHVNKPAAKPQLSTSLVERTTLEGDLDDIDQWDQVLVSANIEKPLTGGMVEAVPVPPAVETPLLVSDPQPQEKHAGKDEPVPAPLAAGGSAAVRPLSKVSMIERMGMLFLLVVLLAGGGAMLVFSLNSLPTERQRVRENDFPVKGAYLTIDSAASYWRAPIMEGALMDTFRRGTQLLPELQLSVRDGPAMLRIYFRNDDRALIGDAVTIKVRKGDTLKIPATAGFDDLGMHAAYRTGESKPWTVEVLEAPVDDASGVAFKKLFEMNISTDRR